MAPDKTNPPSIASVDRAAIAALELELARAWREQGNLFEAVAACSRAHRVQPLDGTPLLILGELTLERGEFVEAARLAREGVKRQPKNAVGHFVLGRALQLSGEEEAAEESYRKAISLWPSFALAHLNLALVLFELGKHEEALAAGRTAIKLDPTMADAHLIVGQALSALRRWPQAEAPLRKAVGLGPELVAAHCGLGWALHHLARSDEAIASHRSALERNPDFAPAWSGIGAAYRALGRFDEAVIHLTRALEINPNFGEAQCELAICRKADETASDLSRMVATLENPALDIPQRVSAGFGLGKSLDDLARYDEAFARYSMANLLFREHVAATAKPFDADELRSYVDAIIGIFTPEFLEIPCRAAVDSSLPVFIVGLYRSGTTLTEQILASHPDVAGAGELQDIRQLAAKVIAALRRSDRLDLEKLHAAASRHLAKLCKIGPGKVHVVDKHPDNIFSLGVIRLLFPAARIIMCHRDPLDNILSCYFQRFSETMVFSNDLIDCGRRYLAVERLANHWRKVLPRRVLDIQYETLVTDLPGETRRMLAFLDLPWDSACLDYFKTERTVNTPSAWAVRQPIYASSVGRWQNYAAHLVPLVRMLEESGSLQQNELGAYAL